MKKIFPLAFLLLSLTAYSQDWQLVWSDEFNGTSLNTNDWIYDLGTGSQFGLNGWGNNELQYYTNNTANVSVADGMLRIRAQQENVGGMNYTSGRIRTVQNQFWTYGKIEARMKMPAGQGLWPAFWMLPEGGFWPGEIDIMEIIGSQPTILHGTTHSGTTDNVFSLGGSYTSANPLTDEFHTYAIEWIPDNIIWLIDDVPYFSMNRNDLPADMAWLFDEDYYVLLNLAVGGNWPGSPDGTTSFPADFLIDYVRVYEYDETAVSDVTLRVDVSEQLVQAGDIVYLTGVFNNWCSTCEPMTDEGNGVWSSTISLPPGLHEYKYTVNGWNGLVEGWSNEEACTMQTISGLDSFINRVVNVGFAPLQLPPNCFNECELCVPLTEDNCTDSDAVNFNPNALFDDGSCLYQVLFSVDMGQESLGINDFVHLNGSFNNWCGTCNEMFDLNNDGVYTAALNLPPGTYEYKFTTNGWDGEQELFNVGTSCTNTTYGNQGEVWTNRVFVLGANPAQLNEVCFNSCVSCVYSVVPMTFRVDMFIEGNPAGLQLEMLIDGMTVYYEMVHLGWGLWSTTISANEGTSAQYRFVADGTIEVVDVSCSTNNYRTVTIEEIILDSVCFDECEGCDGCVDPLYANFNPYAVSNDLSCIEILQLGCTYAEGINFNPQANYEDGSCLFETEDACPEDFNNNGIVDTPDLLAFLGAFNLVCL